MNKRELKARVKELKDMLRKEDDVEKFDQLKADIKLVEQQLRDIEEAEFSLLRAADTLTVEDLVRKYHIAYLADDDKFSITWNTSNDPDGVNITSKTIHSTRIINSLNTLLPADQQIQKMRHEDIIKYCEQNDRAYLTMTSSFNTNKWAFGCYNQLTDLRKFWVERVAGDVNPAFDDLIYSIAGGRQENIDHIEQWVAYKYLFPEQTVNIPHVNISGIPGENGKGLFKILLKTVFTAGSVVNATSKELVNGFNAKWKDAVILVYEEMAERELPENRIKSVTGDPELSVELKGKDAFIVDANYSILFFDNNVNGTVKLAGSGPNGEDRRYSIIETNVSLPRRLQDKYDIDEDTAKLACQSIADLLNSRAEVGRWINHLIEKHRVEHMTHPPKLHGEDYWNRVNNQKTDLDTLVVDLVDAVERTQVLPIKLMTDYVKERGGEDVKASPQRLGKLVIAGLKRRGHTPEKYRVRKVYVNYDKHNSKHDNAMSIGIGLSRAQSTLHIDHNPFEQLEPTTEGIFDYE
jgi:hypothetical protein